MKKIKKTKKWLFDLVFPFFCLNCRCEGWPLCPACQKKVSPLSWQVCPVCEKALTEKGCLCPICKQNNFPLDNLIVATDYQDPLVAEAIHLFKYNFVKTLQPFLGKLLLAALIKNEVTLPDFILPVPLHPWRLRWRGFNQAQLLADYLGKNLAPGLEIPVVNNWLVRRKKTASQMKISDAEKRKSNLTGAFALNLPLALEGKNKKILIVDDVCTTGATLVECANTLKPLRPKNLSAIVIGRQK